jgi:hypothetical protein
MASEKEETPLVGAMRGRLKADLREGLVVIRPHEVGQRERDPVALNVDGEPECRHFMNLLMETRVELRSRGSRW